MKARLTKNQPKLSSLIDKAIFDYKMIENGDKILIGASGGKDSTALIQYFANRSKRPDCNFDYKAVHIHSDFAPPFPPGILDLFKNLQVPFESLDVNILGRIKPGQKMNCYWCSTQRRTELLHYAMSHGFNKICLGHHLDDLLETFLMNMLGKGELSTMPPKLAYENFPITIIRPLCYVSEKRLVEEAKDLGYYGYTCTCDYQENSTRKEARSKLEALTGGDEKVKERMFKALKNIQKDYLP